MTVIFSYISNALEYWGYNLISFSFLLISCLWVALLILVDRYKLAKQRRKNEKECNQHQTKEDSTQKQEIIRLISIAPLGNTMEQASLSMRLEMLAPLMSESTRSLVEEIARTKIGENATQSQKSAIRSLLEGLDPFSKKVNSLIPRILEGIKNRSISKQAIVFLSSITDDDLEILKRQFRYVLCLPHLDVSQDLGIYNYDLSIDDKLQNILLKENGLIHLESCSLRFFGDVWIGENGSRSSYYKINGSHVIGDIDSKKRWNLQIETKVENAQEQQILFHAYTCLSQIGIEIFNLLKDELEPTPSEYLNKLVEYLAKLYPTVTFKLMEKTQLLENDNS